MPDIADEANDTAELFLTEALSKSRQCANNAPVAKGTCLYCDEPLAGRRWCDAACRDAWQAEQPRER